MTLDLESIRARYEKATPGPWRWVHTPSAHFDSRPRDAPDEPWGGADNGRLSFDHLRGEGQEVLSGQWCNDGTGEISVGKGEDAAFIAAARTDIPELVAEVERLRALASPAEDAVD